MNKNNLSRIAATLLAVLFLVFSTACGKAGDKGSVPVMELPQLYSQWVLKKEKEYRFDVTTKGGPLIGKVDDPENLYVYFLQNRDNNCEIVKFSTDLELKEKYYIPRAAGPGEAQNPRIYGGTRDFIIVWDAPGYKYIKLDANFKLMDEYRLTKDLGTFLYSGAHYVKEQNCVFDGFSRFINYYDKVVRIYRMEFPTGREKKVREKKLFDSTYLGYRKDNERHIIMKPVDFGWFFGHLYILDKRQYRLIKMDPGGKILKEIKIFFKSKSFAASLRKEWTYKYYPNDEFMQRKSDLPDKLLPANWLMQVGDGIAVGRMENYDPVEQDTIPADYFDPDLNYLGQVELPYFYFWNHPSEGNHQAEIKFYSLGGKLYFAETRDDDEYWIVRYEIRKMGS